MDSASITHSDLPFTVHSWTGTIEQKMPWEGYESKYSDGGLAWLRLAPQLSPASTGLSISSDPSIDPCAHPLLRLELCVNRHPDQEDIIPTLDSFVENKQFLH